MNYSTIMMIMNIVTMLMTMMVVMVHTYFWRPQHLKTWKHWSNHKSEASSRVAFLHGAELALTVHLHPFVASPWPCEAPKHLENRQKGFKSSSCQKTSSISTLTWFLPNRYPSLSSPFFVHSEKFQLWPELVGSRTASTSTLLNQYQYRS